MTVIITIISATCFAILFNVPRRHVILTVALGVLSQSLFSFLTPKQDLPFAIFTTAVIVAVLSQILARLTRSPAQGFLIPGVILMVPGLRVFRGLEHAVKGDYATVQAEIFTALLIACSISFGVLLGAWIVPPKREL